MRTLAFALTHSAISDENVNVHLPDRFSITSVPLADATSSANNGSPLKRLFSNQAKLKTDLTCLRKQGRFETNQLSLTPLPYEKKRKKKKHVPQLAWSHFRDGRLLQNWNSMEPGRLSQGVQYFLFLSYQWFLVFFRHLFFSRHFFY